jgi:hypothetical protein
MMGLVIAICKTLYRIKDYNNDEITRTFYQSKLQKINIPVGEDQMWKLEKILKTIGTRQNKQYFVKWLHWPNKFNSWVKASDTTSPKSFRYGEHLSSPSLIIFFSCKYVP